MVDTIRQSMTTSMLSLRNRICVFVAGLFMIIPAIVIGFLVNSSSNPSWSRVTCIKYGKFCPLTSPFLNMTYMHSAGEQIIPPDTDLAHLSVRYEDRPVLFFFDDGADLWVDMMHRIAETHNIPHDQKDQIDTVLWETGMQMIVMGNLTGHMLDAGLYHLQNYVLRIIYVGDVLSGLPANATLRDKETILELAVPIVVDLVDGLPGLIEQIELPASLSGYHARSIHDALRRAQTLRSTVKLRKDTTGLGQYIRCFFNPDPCQRLADDVQFFDGAVGPMGPMEDVAKSSELYDRGVHHMLEHANFVLMSGTAYLMHADTASTQDLLQLYTDVVRDCTTFYIYMKAVNNLGQE